MQRLPAKIGGLAKSNKGASEYRRTPSSRLKRSPRSVSQQAIQ